MTISDVLAVLLVVGTLGVLFYIGRRIRVTR
jgi:hypothetical protein